MPRVTHLTATNFKRIDALTIDTDGRYAVVLRGPNRSGKTTALDALACLLTGRSELPELAINARSPDAPAQLLAEIEGTALGKLTVHRRFTAKGTTLVVKATDDEGNVTAVTPPQSALDAVIGATSIRPMDILSADRKTRLKALTTAGGIADRWDRIEKERKAAVQAHTEATRAHDAAERTLGPKPKAVPLDAPPAAAASARDALAAAAAEKAEALRHWTEIEGKRVAATGAANEKRKAIADLEARLAQLRASLTADVAAADTASKACAAAVDTGKKLAAEVEALTGAAAEEATQASAWAHAEAARLAAAKEMQSWQARQAELAAASRAKDDTAAAVVALDEAITQALHDSALSQIPGLKIDPEGDIVLNGVPLAQASGMEKVLFGARLALTANPKLPLLAIDEADCLDDAAVKALVDFAVEKDISIWLTGVRLPGEEVHAEILAVDIEDGRRKGEAPTPVQAAPVVDIEL